jgi:hypothetical protein
MFVANTMACIREPYERLNGDAQNSDIGIRHEASVRIWEVEPLQ